MIYILIETFVQILKYCLIGLINTLITFFIILIFSYYGYDPYLSNSFGFIGGLINSFIMNRHFTFRSGRQRSDITRFMISFLIAYGVNLYVLYLSLTLLAFSEPIYQAIAMSAYNITFFILLKLWVFKNAR